MKKVLKDGKWEEGKASPELLSDDLKRLPSDLVTKEPGDADKIWEGDAPHTQDALISDYIDKVTGKNEKKELKESFKMAEFRKNLYKDTSKPIPITDENLGLERMAATVSLISSALILVDNNSSQWTMEHEDELNERLGVHHLWFDDDNILALELRRGNPPPPKSRKKHLRDKYQVVDPMDPDRRVKDLMKERLGVDVDRAKHKASLYENLGPVFGGIARGTLYDD